MEMPDVILDVRNLRDLVAELQSWLAQPLKALAADTLEYSVDLALEPSEYFLLRFGRRADLISAPGGVGCLVELRRNAFSAELAFVTDPTCLQVFADELQKLLTIAEPHS
jgi:hypothetical protein